MRLRRELLIRSEWLKGRNRPTPGATSGVAPLPLPARLESRAQSAISAGTFTFLNQTVALGRPIQWQPEGVDQLWRYQLHAFEYLLPLGSSLRDRGDESDARLFRELVEDWMAACPMGVGTAWDPYPTSLRIRNWIYAYTLVSDHVSRDGEFVRRWLDHLYSQTCYLERFLEYHLLGNHLIENARALLLAGLFFTDRNAERWRLRGERLLWRELERQFLPDGGHQELSPMYHQIMLQLYCEVVELLSALGRPVPQWVRDRIGDLQEWLAAMLHPDGELSLLSDAARGMAGAPGPLIGAAKSVDGLQPLADSGYVVFRDESSGDFAVFDCGRIGPDHQPGHGHCDCLSYELDVAGERILVDSGVGTYYGDLQWRDYYRSTRAHNTVQIDGVEQSEIWDRFRVGRRHQPRGVRWADEDGLLWASAAHDGYESLPDPVTHRRWMCWIDRRFWLICDRISGSGRHRVESFLHFHPDAKPTVSPSLDGRFAGTVQRGDVSVRILAWGAQDLREMRGQSPIHQGWCATEFNRPTANSVWSFETEGELPVWLAYVFWPDSGRLTAKFSAHSVDRLEAAIETDVSGYRIVCSETEVELSRA